MNRLTMRLNRSIFALLSALFVMLSVLLPGSATAADPLIQFETPEQTELYEELINEMRCLKCQNQTLADSAADLAGDLREEIADQVRAKQSREQITDYLLQRYGDFVLYRPRLTGANLFLWFGPFLLLAIGLFAGWRVIRQSKQHTVAEPDESALSRARSLLDD